MTVALLPPEEIDCHSPPVVTLLSKQLGTIDGERSTSLSRALQGKNGLGTFPQPAEHQPIFEAARPDFR